MGDHSKGPRDWYERILRIQWAFDRGDSRQGLVRELAADVATLASEITDLVAALIREHDANHPNPAGPTCGCSTCVLLARLNTGETGGGR